jgi:hypothetical protein
MIAQVIQLCLVTIVNERYLGMVKLLLLLIILFQKVLLVDSLDYNSLSMSQLCEMCYNCLFTNKGVIVFRRSDGSYIFSGILK